MVQEKGFVPPKVISDGKKAALQTNARAEKRKVTKADSMCW